MRKTVFTGLGAMIALFFVSAASIAGPPNHTAQIELTYLQMSQSADIAYESAVAIGYCDAWVGQEGPDLAVLASTEQTLLFRRMPSFPSGDEGSRTISVSTFHGQEVGVFDTSVKPVGAMVNA